MFLKTKDIDEMLIVQKGFLFWLKYSNGLKGSLFPVYVTAAALHSSLNRFPTPFDNPSTTLRQPFDKLRVTTQDDSLK